MKRKRIEEDEITRRLDRANDAFSEYAVLDILRKRELTDTANYLHSQL